MSKYAITIKNLTKTYRLYDSNKKRILESLFPFVKQHHKDFHALLDVSFGVKKGEIVGIIGKNGSGKSTLLKIITGVLTPTDGEIQINGRISALLELGTGFNPEYTGMENIFLSGTLNGIPREEMQKRVPDILDFADIGDFVHQPVKNYSSGMFVRLAFAVAVSVDPEILIVDEALSVGDAAFQAKCMSRMMQIMKQGATVLFVTHDMDIIKRLCERCIYLENGRILKEGPAAELADMYLRKARENMNKENISLQKELDGDRQAVSEEKKEKRSSKGTVYPDQEFEKRVQRFREGDGKVKVIRTELTDDSGVEQTNYKYNQQVHLKIFIRFYEKCSNVGVGYHIRDGKNTEIIGSGLQFEGKELLSGDKGEVFCISYATRLPLMAGAYNVTLVVSSMLVSKTTFIFHDLIENAKVFEVEENENAKLWDKVYVPNTVTVTSCDIAE